MTILGFIPARGGSKSIPHKNMVPLMGRPLLEFGVRAAQHAGVIDSFVCSTEDPTIARHARALGVEVDPRPHHLCADDTPVAEVVLEYLQRTAADVEIIVLIQPTSPFLLPEHVRAVCALLRSTPHACSAQTIAPLPHNHHPLNARQCHENIVDFTFADKRLHAYNKQRKPPLYAFGNLVAVRTTALLEANTFFAQPSIGHIIQRPYDFDLDEQHDIAIAEALLRGAVVTTPHLEIM